MQLARGKEAEKEIERMVGRIAERFNPQKIILFGSYARGAGGPDSDVDLLVIMPISGSKRQIAIQMDVALADRRLPLDLLVVTPEEADRGSQIIGSAIRAAMIEGNVLYERAA